MSPDSFGMARAQFDMLQGATVDDVAADSYQALKQRVHKLKSEHRKAMVTKNATQEFESVALLQQRHQFESLLKERDEDLIKLQQQLHKNTERAAKLRQQHERERKTLLAQLDGLHSTLAGTDAKHAEAAAAAASTHLAEASALRAELQRLEATRRAELIEAERDKQRCLEDVDGWCTGEVDAVRHQAQQQVEEARAEARQWRDCADERDALRAAEAAAAATTAAQLQEAQARGAEASNRLAELQRTHEAVVRTHEAERRRALAEAQHMQAQHADEVASLKAEHAQQLVTINSKLQVIVGKKDSTILALKAELQGVNGRFMKLEQLLGSSQRLVAC